MMNNPNFQGVPDPALTETPNGTFYFVVDGKIVFYPYRAIGGGPARPSDFGFEELWTGGGCKAWGRNFTLEGRPVHMAITDTGGTSLDADTDGACMVGVYEGPLDAAFSETDVAVWVQLNAQEALSLDEFSAREKAAQAAAHPAPARAQ